MDIEKIIRVEPEPMERTRRRKSRIFIWDGSLSLQEQILNRNDRPISDYAELIPEAIEAAGLTGVERIQYADRACTCGCTPGFVADAWLRDERGHPYDLHITVTNRNTSRAPKLVESEAQAFTQPPAQEPANESNGNGRRRRVPEAERVPMAARQTDKTERQPRTPRTPREQLRARRQGKAGKGVTVTI